jgi:hypothetical protein
MQEVLPILAESPGCPQGEMAVLQGFFKGRIEPCSFKNRIGLDGHSASFVNQVIDLGPYQAQIRETEVHHSPADAADIQGTLGLDENDGQIVKVHNLVQLFMESIGLCKG